MVCFECLETHGTDPFAPHEVLGVDLLSPSRIVASAHLLRDLLFSHGILLLSSPRQPDVPPENLRLLMRGICGSETGEEKIKLRVLGNSKGGLLCKTGLEWHTDGEMFKLFLMLRLLLV